MGTKAKKKSKPKKKKKGLLERAYKEPRHGSYSRDGKLRYYRGKGGKTKVGGGQWVSRNVFTSWSKYDKYGGQIPKTKTFGGKTYSKPSKHNNKKSAQDKAKKHRSRGKGSHARVVKVKDHVGAIKYVVYRRGGKRRWKR